MSNIPFPLTAESQDDLRSQFFELIRQLYEDRIGGLLLGDVFMDEGDYLSLRLDDYGGLEKSLNELQIKIKADGGLSTASTGALIKCKPFGGCATDANGLYVASSGSAGAGSGMRITIKDADELYVWGGWREINGAFYQAAAQLTVDASGLTADTLYYVYVNAPVSPNTTLSAANFSLSTTGPTYDHAKGAYYKTGDGTKRLIGFIRTAA